MRIIAGKYRSLPLKSPQGQQTRPTLDKVRESVFQILGPYFAGGRVLDLYGGSGAIGLEALSRGMDELWVADVRKEAISAIKDNIAKLRVENQVRLVFNRDEFVVRMAQREGVLFDLIYLDPPYGDVRLPAIASACLDLLTVSGRLVIETDVKQRLVPAGTEVLKERTYGSTRIIVLGKESS